MIHTLIFTLSAQPRCKKSKFLSVHPSDKIFNWSCQARGAQRASSPKRSWAGSQQTKRPWLRSSHGQATAHGFSSHPHLWELVETTPALTRQLSLISELSSCFTQQLHWIFSPGFLRVSVSEHSPVQSRLPASQHCLQVRGLFMESSFCAGFGSLPFLPRGLCEAPHQHCPPGGSSSLERGYKNGLWRCSLPHPLLSPILYCSSPSWWCNLVQCETATIHGKTILICTSSTIFRFGIMQK